MTVNFTLEGIRWTVSGTKHIRSKPGLFGFDVHSVHVEGHTVDVKPILACDFLERLNEAAAEATEETIPFESANQVEDALEVTRAEHPAPTVAVLDVAGKRLVELSVELVEGGR